MDIKFENNSNSGIIFAKQINKISPNCLIIFVSSYSKYLVDCYDAEHIFYILKDQIDLHLKKSLIKAIAYLNEDNNKISIKVKGETILLETKEVIYIEKNLRKVKIFMKNNTYETYLKFSDLFEMIDNNEFVQCHKSYIINLNYIKSIDNNLIIISKNLTIPISRTYKSNFLLSFNNKFLK